MHDCDACESCPSIWSILKPVFHQIRLICCATQMPGGPAPSHEGGEGSGVMPIHKLYLLQPGVQPNQIALNIMGCPTCTSDQSGARSS